MSEPPDRHVRFRELLSDRLDGQLPAEDERDLQAHLAGCPPCRTVARDYADQHRSLAALPPIPPPRDLWARTNAALDREMARGHRRRRRVADDDIPVARRPASPLLMLSSLASLVLAVIVVGTQLDQATSVSPPPSGLSGVAPTPFEIPTQELAFVDLGADGITVYQTALSEVCPQPAIDCSLAQLAAYPVARIPGKLAPRGLALHPDDHKLALLAEDDLGSETISVVLLPSTSVPDGSGTGIGPDGVARTAVPAPQASASSVATVAAATPTAAPTGGLPTKGPVQNTARPTGGQHATPRPSVSQRPGSSHPAGPSASPLPTTSSATAGGGSAGASLRTSAAPTGDPGDGVTGGIPTLVPAAVVAILDGVRTTGAPPEWSPDGSMLAFSAMPADRSQGPDVYTWRSGDAKAQRLTTDHRSDFASWSGSRIVVSREPVRGSGASAALTFVIDPATGEERAVIADSLWLPAVDPAGRWAVTWRGQVVASDRGVDLRSGELFVIDWRALDPFRDHKATQVGGDHATPSVAPSRPPRTGGKGHASPTPRPDATSSPPDEATTDPTTTSDATTTTESSGTDASSPSATSRAARPSAETRGHRPRNRPARQSPAPTLAATPTLGDAPVDAVVQAVEPERDVRTDPVVDWQVAWSDDGSTFGYWVADTPGANWGRLSVVRIARETGHIERGEQVLGPTLARRAFAVGADRVAWVAPSDDGSDGELRVRAWGASGDGGLRLRDVNLDQAVPAF